VSILGEEEAKMANTFFSASAQKVFGCHPRGSRGMRQLRTSAILLIATVGSIMASAASLVAGGTQYWDLQNQATLVRGEIQGISITREGRLVLAPRIEHVFDTGQAFIWSVAADQKGTLYLGTGHDGKLFRVERNGTGQLVFDSDELDVTALAVDPGGTVYAGTSPNGKVYRLPPQGEPTVFFDPEDTYIWSLVFFEDSLYVGTGVKGRVYKVAGNGTARLLADTRETNIMRMIVDAAGNLIVGTDPSGLVLRITPTGKQFALYDAPLREVHDLILSADGSIYALALSDRGPTPAASPPGAPSLPAVPTVVSSTAGVTVTITSTDVTPPLSATDTDAQSMTSAVYRLDPSGAVETLWTTNTFSAFSLARDGGGDVFVGTNDKGRLYRLDPSGSATVVTQLSEGQVSRLLADGSALYAVTSNLGKLFRLGPDRAVAGTYESTVLDARFPAQWGTISWRAQAGSIEVQTRSGNTETPDASWSEWSAPCGNGETVSSPAARFLQLRVRLKPSATSQGTAWIEGLRVAYLPQNVKPTISALDVLPPGVALQEVPQQPLDPGILSSGLDPNLFGVGGPVPPRKVYQRGARSLQWTATDPNGDQLVYTISYRAASDAEWKVLATDLTDPYYTIDADALPDGLYVFKVSASDAPSNPPDRARTAERTTDVVLIDNTPPLVRSSAPRISGLHVEVDFTAEDATSTISRAEMSVDGGRWQLVFPADGVADSPSERYTVRIDFTRRGEHTITLRVSDANTNIGWSKITVRVP